MSTMNETVPYTVPRERGGWRAIVLAVLMHLFLLLFLWVGVRWQNETPQTVEAEVWSPQLREAAPLPVVPPPAEPVKAPEPEPKPVVKEPPKPAVEEPPVVKPDIALEQEKKRKALEKKKAEEDIARLKQKQKEEADKLAKAKLDEERLKKEKLEKELAEKDKLEKDKAEKLAKAEKEKKDKAAAEEKRKQAEEKRRQEEATEKLMAKAREEEMRRITGGAVGTGGTGDAAKSQGPRGDPSYVARVGAKIKSNIVYIAPEELSDNSAVEFVVDLLPDGSIAGMRKTRSSKAPGFDEAVRRAIEKSQPFPKDKTGSVPSSFIGVHRPKDQ